MNIFARWVGSAALVLALTGHAHAAETLPPMNAADNAIFARMPQLLADGAVHILGNPQGDVTIIEFFDYQCPYTRNVAPRVSAAVRADGNVKLVLKSFPVIGPGSRIGARAAYAAKLQGKNFAAFHEALLAYKGVFTKEAMQKLAGDAGLNPVRLSDDMDTLDAADAVTVNFDQARSIKVTSTPSFIIDGHLMTEPSAEIDFPKAIAAARAKNK